MIVGRTALASDAFLLEDLPGTSGRLDVLLRCVRAALLTSHGMRRDVVVDLVLLGGPRAPRTLRFDGATAKFVRPDERPLATLAKKALATDAASPDRGFVEVRPGVSLANGGLEASLADLGAARPFVLDEAGNDIRDVALGDDHAFFVGDHLGFDDATRARLAAIGAQPLCVGPVSLHSDDVVAIVSNELDRLHRRSR